MNKKEVLEIRKQFSPDNCAITRICGCYVDHEKNIIMRSKDAFLSLPEEEEFKYFDILRHTLSGKLGKNLVELEFSNEEEAAGGKQEFLLKLRDSRLEDDALIDQFYEKVIQSFEYVENYFIILVSSTYDIPGKASDGTQMFDSSDEVYCHIMCSICPVKLAKPGLSYVPEKNTVESRDRDWVIGAPINGFLFPAFNDRSTDIHHALAYEKKPDNSKEEFYSEMFGTDLPIAPDTQKEIFQDILEEVLDSSGSYDTVKNIFDEVCEFEDENKDNPEPPALEKGDIRRILSDSGVTEEGLKKFDAEYDRRAGAGTKLLVSNILNTKQFHIDSPDVTVKVDPERTDLVETKIVDGRQCIVIAVNDRVEVNGINVHTLLHNKN